MTLEFDVIVVGAGPAGSIASLTLAKAGLKVALLERGRQPGSKNIFGGLLHNTPVLNELFPDFEDKAPIERQVYKKSLAFITPGSSVNMTFETNTFHQTPHNGYTVMRPIFDNWLAQQAVAAGANLYCDCCADNLIMQGGQVGGVSVKGRQGEIRSKIVIAADGVLSFMAEKAGLHQRIPASQMGLGIKLLLGLPAQTINDRFGLNGFEGADYALLGITGGLRGGGFLYTNNESLSIGMVVHLDSLKASGKAPYDVLNAALEQPQIKKLVKGGVPLEYSAHLVPEGGIKGVPGLFKGGMLVTGDAAGLCYTNGLNLEGINLAMTSGALAAECSIEAIKNKDYSAARLSSYKKRLESSFVLKDMRTFGKAVEMMQIDRLFETYPALVCQIFENIYKVDGQPRQKMLKVMRQAAKGKVGLSNLLSDGLKMGRGLL
jgi:electron transfer flavoprotein-quinone oxidoreductase